MKQPPRKAVACDAADGETAASTRMAERVSESQGTASAKRDLFLKVPVGGRLHRMSSTQSFASRSLPSWISGIMAQFGQETPPHVGGRLRGLVESKTVECTTTGAVILNCFFMVHSVNYECRHGASSSSTFIVVAEAAFFVFYFLELVFKLLCYRCWYFKGDGARLNWLDFFLVVINALSLVDLALASSSSPADDVSTQQFKLLRLLKLFRVARVARVLNEIKELRVLMGLFSKCWRILFWSLVMWVLILFMCSVFFAQRYAAFCDGAEHENCPRKLSASFGSVQASMLTLFSATNGGIDWMEVWHLLEPTGTINLLCYLSSVLFLQIAVVNIVIGLFVDSAVQSTVKSRETLAKERAMQDVEAKRDLAKLFHEFGDSDAGGTLSKEEWEAAMQRSEVHSFMELMGLRPADVIEYFDILMSDSESQEVSISDLVDGCMISKGSASHFDTLRVMAEINEAASRITAMLPDAGKQAGFTAHDADVLS